MKHRPTLLAQFVAIIAVSSLMVSTGMADDFETRIFGLRFSEPVYKLSPYSLSGQAGIVISGDVFFIGTRARYAVWDNLRVYGDMGILDAGSFDPRLSLQVGATYDLPIASALPVDFAVDTAVAKPFIEHIDALKGRVSLVGKYDLRDSVPGLLTFAGLGMSYTDAQRTDPGDISANGGGVELDIGADYRITENISLNAGVGLLFGNGISETAISVGVTYSPPLAK